MTTHHLTAGCPFGNDEILVDIEFDFSPAEPMQPYPDLPNPGPGCDAYAEFVSARAKEWPIDLPPFLQAKLETWARAYLASDAGIQDVIDAMPDDSDRADDLRDEAIDRAMDEGRC